MILLAKYLIWLDFVVIFLLFHIKNASIIGYDDSISIPLSYNDEVLGNVTEIFNLRHSDITSWRLKALEFANFHEVSSTNMLKVVEDYLNYLEYSDYVLSEKIDDRNFTISYRNASLTLLNSAVYESKGSSYFDNYSHNLYFYSSAEANDYFKSNIYVISASKPI